MSFALLGIGVCDGVAIGSARLISTVDFEVVRRPVAEADIEKEVARFEKALAQAKNEIRHLI